MSLVQPLDIILDFYTNVTSADAETLLLDVFCSALGLEHAVMVRTSSLGNRQYSVSNRAKSLSKTMLADMGDAPIFQSVIETVVPWQQLDLMVGKMSACRVPVLLELGVAKSSRLCRLQDQPPAGGTYGRSSDASP